MSSFVFKGKANEWSNPQQATVWLAKHKLCKKIQLYQHWNKLVAGR